MVVEHYVEGYENFKKFVTDFKDDDKKIYVYFTGSKMPSGESWCDDCQRALPILKDALKETTDENSHIIFVEVGDRTYWKDFNNPFRKDPNTNLLVIPTLIKWKGHQKLEGAQCENKDLLLMLLNDEDE